MPFFQLFERSSPFADPDEPAHPVFAVTPGDIAGATLEPRLKDWAEKVGFSGDAGAFTLAPGADATPTAAMFGLGENPADAPFLTGSLARMLPAGCWRIEGPSVDPFDAALGFGLGSYDFDRFRAARPRGARLAPAGGLDAVDAARQLGGVFLARDLVNLPTNHMGPDALESAFRRLADHYAARVTVTMGDALLENGFPMIHAVGRAGGEAPRLLEMRWGREGAPKVALVGKGVCFDTGGLDIKPASSMLLMKKDMGGAANVMALAMMLMDAGIDLDLRVLVPAVENSISGNAFRPGDILDSRKGLTVQIDNTDAEGRLVLADALAFADEDKPDLMIDMATLTGAARVALGQDVPPFYTHDGGLAGRIAAASEAVHDPLWRMPLYKPYDAELSTPIADITNAPPGGFAGSITAALFLNRFVAPTTRWVHLDIYAWNRKARPHSPAGGEAQGIRALYRTIGELFAKA